MVWRQILRIKTLRDLFQTCKKNNFSYYLKINKNYVTCKHEQTNASDLLPEIFDLERFGSEEKVKELKKNIENRKSICDVDQVVSLYKKFKKLDNTSPDYEITRRLLRDAVRKLPNSTHPQVPVGNETKARTVLVHESKKETGLKDLKSAQELAVNSGCLVSGRETSFLNGSRSYHLSSHLALLQDAIVQYAVDRLLKNGFQLISVPDLVLVEDVESSGFLTEGDRTQVYKASKQVCLAGTGEMGVASYLRNKTFKLEELPLRLVTVSRCFRAETSDIERERGLYRVHHFTKVEMFAVTANQTGLESGQMLEEFLGHQTGLFAGLDLSFRVLDMPTEELGLSAHCKYDIETWLPAKKFWAELSSASNCTDYQSSRLHTLYHNHDRITKACHTVNGTASAIPRLIIAIIENFQQEDGSVLLPESLHAYMGMERMMGARMVKKKKKNISSSSCES